MPSRFLFFLLWLLLHCVCCDFTQSQGLLPRYLPPDRQTFHFSSRPFLPLLDETIGCYWAEIVQTIDFHKCRVVLSLLLPIA